MQWIRKWFHFFLNNSTTTDKCNVTFFPVIYLPCSYFSLIFKHSIDHAHILLSRITSSLSAVNISASVRVTWWASSGNALNVTSGPYKYLPAVYTTVLSIFPVDFCCLNPNCNIYDTLTFTEIETKLINSRK